MMSRKERIAVAKFHSTDLHCTTFPRGRIATGFYDFSKEAWLSHFESDRKRMTERPTREPGEHELEAILHFLETGCLPC